MAAAYPRVHENACIGPITNDVRANYFARFSNASVVRIKNLYLAWARLKGPFSKECQQLNSLFSNSIDGAIVKILQNLENLPAIPPEHPAFVLDILHEAVGRIEIEAAALDTMHISSADAIEALLQCDDLPISEFELINMTLRWCRLHEVNFLHFACYFNYSALSDEEQTWLLAQIPPNKDYPALVKNAMLQSGLVTSDQLAKFHLNHVGLHWRLIFDADTERMERFPDVLCHTLQSFERKLILIKPDPRLIIAVYIPIRVPRARETSVDDKIRVFTFPITQEPHSSNFVATPTRKNYRIYCDETKLQIYNGTKSDTLVFLTQSTTNESNAGNCKTERSRRQQIHKYLDSQERYACCASVALNKVNKRVQQHVGRINRSGISKAVSVVPGHSLPFNKHVSV